MQRLIVSHDNGAEAQRQGVVPFGECRYSAWLAHGELLRRSDQKCEAFLSTGAAERSEQLFNATCGLGEPPPPGLPGMVIWQALILIVLSPQISFFPVLPLF